MNLGNFAEVNQLENKVSAGVADRDLVLMLGASGQKEVVAFMLRYKDSGDNSLKFWLTIAGSSKEEQAKSYEVTFYSQRAYNFEGVTSLPGIETSVRVVSPKPVSMPGFAQELIALIKDIFPEQACNELKFSDEDG